MNKNHDDKKNVDPGTSLVPENSAFGASAGKLILRLFGPLADEIGQYLADGFRQWRWRRDNFRRVAERCEKENEARGIDDDALASVAEGDAYRLAEACSFEDDEMVQELWAGLITSAMDPEKEVVSTRAFVEILKAIGPVETGLLLVLYQLNRTPKDRTIPNLPNLSAEELHNRRQNISDQNKIWKSEIIALANRVYRRFSESQKEVAIQNLFRLRCIGLRTGRNLSQNQTRSGLPFGVSATDAAPTYESFVKVADYLESLIMVGTGTGSYKQGSLSSPHPLLQELPEMRFELTRLGWTLVSVCMTEALQWEVVQGVAK